MTDDDLKEQWQWRGQVLPEGWPNVPEAPTDHPLSPESKSDEDSSSKEESVEQGKSPKSPKSKRASWKRSLALADEIPDISDASRQALREAAV